MAAASRYSAPCLLLRFWAALWAAAAGAQASWCIARSNVSDQALQAALDYACGAGADCVPLQPTGLCYLPNTVQAHASYAFNSYYQRKAMAPGSCDFAGAAVVAVTDPSYGSCVFPSSTSAAGGTAPVTSPGTNTPTPGAGGGGGGGTVVGGGLGGTTGSGTGTGVFPPIGSTNNNGGPSMAASPLHHLFIDDVATTLLMICIIATHLIV